MTICAVADCHLGNHKRFGGPVEASLNRRCRLTLDVFRAAAGRAIELKASAFVVLGDLFDDDRPPPQLLAEVQAVLSRLSTAGVAPVLLVGNHDQTSTDPRDHALGPLASSAVVVSQPRTLVVGRGASEAVELGLLPFYPGAAGDYIRGAAAALEWRTTGRPRALCAHAGVRDEKTAAWLRDAEDAVDAAELVEVARGVSAGVVLAGNWHDRRRWQSRGGSPVDVLQLGALIPTGWDNPGVDGYGTLAVWGADGAVRFESLPGPRFVKVASEADLRVQLAFAEKTGARLFVRWEAPPDDLADCSRRLVELTEWGKVAAGEVVAGEQKAAEKAWAAAEAARSASSLEEALGAYVAEMDVPKGVDRDDVLARCRKYLGL